MERDLNDTTLAKFVSGGLDNIMKAMQVISSASRVGLQTMLVIAILGAAGLAIGMKLQGCLSNFAGATGKEKPKEPHSSNRLNSQPERKTF